MDVISIALSKPKVIDTGNYIFTAEADGSELPLAQYILMLVATDGGMYRLTGMERFWSDLSANKQFEIRTYMPTGSPQNDNYVIDTTGYTIAKTESGEAVQLAYSMMAVGTDGVTMNLKICIVKLTNDYGFLMVEKE